MNKTILMGRLTKDPEVKYLQDENSTAMARYTLAVDRRYRKDGKAETDFISCVTFGKNAEFVEKYHQRDRRRTLFCRREEIVRSRKERRYRSRWIYASSRRRGTSV